MLGVKQEEMSLAALVSPHEPDIGVIAQPCRVCVGSVSGLLRVFGGLGQRFLLCNRQIVESSLEFYQNLSSNTVYSIRKIFLSQNPFTDIT